MTNMRTEFEKEYDWPSLDERQRLIVDGSCWSVWQKAWQASRAALRVELPDDGIADCQRDWPNSCRDNFDTGYCYATDRIIQALQQAGIEVK